MKVKDLVSFSKETFFNGAVQTEWFYDATKVKLVAESYVFHGPKYYGVSASDVKAGEHRLMDTASFAQAIAHKLYSSNPGNNFVMTIAGYGTGKSHLAVCLGALFSGTGELAESIASNISSADEEIGTYIRQNNVKKNLVIVLNGMNNFNLDSEILRCARLSLAQNGISDELLKKLTKSYDVARHFVDRTFAIYQSQFEKYALEVGINISGQALKDYLVSRVENDSRALTAINDVYREVNGDSITWDRGLSAGDILLTLQDELCGNGKPFNKVLLLFDEFGRYIEYTAANPAIAGEAALQQIFEAAQSANGNIIFVGFIQSELEAYLARIEKTSNITRYIARYQTASENLFLSSNFETILANILKKSNPAFNRVVGESIVRYENYHLKSKNALSRWDRTSTKKSVWITDELYKNVILNGCYPLHPITVWLLSSSHQWMQQRSTLAYVSEMFDTVSEAEIDGTFLPYVYPYQIVDSGIFGEMLNSEEKGLVSSQYCMLYRDILVKVGDKLSELEKVVLKSVLVVNIGRMAFYDKTDALKAIQLCSNCKEDEVQSALKSLEEMHGVVAFDDHAKTYDLIAEANGFNEFKRIFTRYRIGVKASIDDIDESALKLMALDTPVETAFAQDHHISSTEWMFNKRLIDCSEISENYLRNEIRNITENCDGEKARGLLIYAYCSEDITSEVNRLSRLYCDLNLRNYPIIILFLDDHHKEMLTALIVKKSLQRFSTADKERFQKHISNQLRAQNTKLCRKFTSCVSQRHMIGVNGLENYAVRINALCSKKFDLLYTRAVPFVFDGFENKSKTQAKTTLTQVCCYLYNRLLTNQQGYNALSSKDKNRVNSVLSISAPFSWKVYDNRCQLIEPGNPIIAEIISNVVSALDDGERHSVYQLFYKFVQAPYGMNENSISLLVSYFIAFQENRYFYFYGTERLMPKHWSTDKGKLKVPEFKKINIQKNANAGIDLVAELCDKIMSNTDISNCVNLKNSLTMLVAQEGETESNQYKIGQAITYLDAGIRLERNFTDQLRKAQNHIEDLKKQFRILSFVKIFDLIPRISDPIEDGLEYVYTEKQKNDVLKLKAIVEQMLPKLYLPMLSALDFKFEELSENQKRYRHAAEILRANEYEDYADATEHRLTEIEKSLRAKQKYESSLVECERDLTQSKNLFKLADCEEMEAKLNGWVEFFSKTNELPTDIIAPLNKRIKNAKNELCQKKAELLNEYTAAIDNASTVETVIQLRQSISKISMLMQMQLGLDSEQTLLKVQSDIDDAIHQIETLPQNLDNLNQFIYSLNHMQHRCLKAIKHGATALQADLIQKQAIWVKRYIEEAERSYMSMSAIECQNWLDKTASHPIYLQAPIIERLNKTRELVESQLHSCRVDGLLAMYDKLSESEKQTFKKLLLAR